MKGLAAGLIGLLLGTVGIDPITGAERFTFGQMYLIDGVPLIPVILALFAFPRSLEIIRQVISSNKKRLVEISGKVVDVAISFKR